MLCGDENLLGSKQIRSECRPLRMFTNASFRRLPYVLARDSRILGRGGSSCAVALHADWYIVIEHSGICSAFAHRAIALDATNSPD
jgi:hypothetical protein